MRHSSTSKGFTLIEVIITVGILSLIVGIGFFNLTGFKSKHSFDLDAENITASIRNAHNRALLGEGGVSWGMRFVSTSSGGSYEIFSGTEYASSTVISKDNLSIASRLTNPPSGFSKTIIFTPITGMPGGGDSIVLKRTSGSDVYVISISDIGKTSTISETGLVAHWPFDEGLGENVFNVALSNDMGTLVNNPLWRTSSCASGNCLEFDGINQHITILSPSVGAEDVSVTFWMYPDTLSNSTILGTTGTYTRMLQIQDSTQVEFNLGESGVNNYFPITSSFQTGQWQHVVVTKNFQGEVKVYLNGEDVTLGSPTISNVTDITWNLIGSEKLGDGKYFNGRLDDIRVYDKELTAEDVTRLYESY